MNQTSFFLQLVLPGLTAGCVYALIALGFVLTATVSRLVNFAQGEYVMLGGIVTASLVSEGVALPLAILIAVLCGTILGALQERLTVAPVRHASHFIQITITLGLSIVIRGIALLVFGKDPISFPGFSGDGTFRVGGAILPLQTLWVWGSTAILLCAVFWFLRRTDTGRAVRACAINDHAAALMGINVERTTLFVFAASGAIGAIAGVVITPIVLANWDAGLAYGLKGFMGAIIAGFSSPLTAVLAGLGLGVVEAMAAGYVSSGWKDFILFGLLLVYLLVRGGIFAVGRAALPSNNIK